VVVFASRRACHRCGAEPPSAGGGAREQQAAALSAVAKEMNAFRSDGSFFSLAGGGPGGGDSDPDSAQERAPSPPPPAAAAAAPAAPAAAGNASAAAALRARLLGRPPPAAAAAPVAGAAAAPADSPAVEMLPLVGLDGRAAPGAFGRAPAAPQGVSERKPAKLDRFGGGAAATATGAAVGERTRYYADDDSASLRDLVAAERHTAGAPSAYEANLARNVARQGGRWKGGELGVDAEYDHDSGLEMYEKGGRRKTGAEAAEKAKQAQVSTFQRAQLRATTCLLCVDSPASASLLRLALATKTYLALPELARLVPGHVVICPAAHGGSGRSCDEEVHEEMRNFKKCLLRMAAAQGGGTVLFWETYLGAPAGGAGLGRHCVLEALPLPPGAAASAPLLFRKAIEEAESEWSTHDAKKLIPLGGASGRQLRNAIPPQFPYFHVEFGLSSGFVHVIDDTTKWNPHFGRDVLIGLLGLPAERAHQRARRHTPQELQAHKTEFLAAYAPFDWTRALD